ncbi:MAG: DUF4384 domain-containing protein [Planctomycetes bacterium]|nr:DUF4384 domain-containing protein [Planctomycetota bacterium]
MERMRGFVAAVGLAVILCPSFAHGGERGSLEELDSRLAKAWMEVAGLLPADKPVTVAVVPFSDYYGGVTKLGSLAAGRLEACVCQHPQVTLVERTRLEELLKEEDIKQSDFAARADRSRQQKALKVLNADYLATGELVRAGDTVSFTLRLVKAGTGKANVSSFAIKSDAAVRDLLVYVRRPPGGEGRTIEVPPMELAFKVSAQSKLPGGVREFELKDGETLKSGGQFQLSFMPASDSWVYIFLFDSRGGCSALFPYPGVKISNRCLGGVKYVVPDPNILGGSRWFVLDENTGTERLFIVASYEPVGNIDRILDDMSKMRGGSGALGRRLKDEMRKVNRNARNGSKTVPGLRLRRPSLAPEPPTVGAGETLRGRFAVVKEFRIEHR